MTTEKEDPFRWVGETIEGKYRVDALVGEGGFGVVYRAHHLGFGEKVALKCLRVPERLGEKQRERFFESFLAEGRLLHRLSRVTAGIVQALDVGAAVAPSRDWTPYIVMEWLEGKSLEDDLEEREASGAGGRTLQEAIAILDPVARALAVAHEQGIAHRDVKPANIFLAEMGDRRAVKVLDFGIAKVIGDAATTSRGFDTTGESLTAFTAHYGAPEQFSRRYGATGPWTDVFALSLLLVELVRGKRSLEGVDAAELFVSAADPKHRPTFKQLGYEAPEALEPVMLRALEVDPKLRYRTVQEFWQDVLVASGQIGVTPSPPLPDVAVRPPLSSKLEAGPQSLEEAVRLAEPESVPPSGAPFVERRRSPQASTELSSTTPAPGTPPARRGTVALVAALATCLGVALAVAGSLLLRERGAASDPSAVPSVTLAPSVTASEAKSETLLTSSPPRSVPAGTVSGESHFVTEFRLQKLESAFGLTLAAAQRACTDSGLSLCTEAQWARACETHPDIGRTSTWTLSAHPRGFVIRGGASCAVRAVASADSSAPDRGVVCCDRAVALDSRNPNRTFLIATAQRLISVENALNRRQASTFAGLLSDFVTIDGKLMPRADAKAQLEASLTRFPDQWFVLDSCQVDMRAPKRGTRGKAKTKGAAKPTPKPPAPESPREAASWTAQCRETRHRAGEVSANEVLYTFGGSGRLMSVSDLKRRD